MLPDADLDAAIPVIALGLFTNAGEVCAAGTRILVHRSIHDEVVRRLEDTDEAVTLANDTAYGLAACVWTRDLSHAHRIAARVRAATVWVNGWGVMDPALPWGGMKTSGIGRELGWAGILADTEEKVVTIVL